MAHRRISQIRQRPSQVAVSRTTPCSRPATSLNVRLLHVSAGLGAMALLLLRILGFIDYLLTLYIYVLVAWAVLSWLVAFNVVNTRHPVVRAIADFLYRITEPVLRPIRRWMPNFGGIDVSPIVVWLIILFIQWVIIPAIADLIRSTMA
jgi:YggT family protein